MRDTEKVQALQRQIERLQQQNRLSGTPPLRPGAQSYEASGRAGPGGDKGLDGCPDADAQDGLHEGVDGDVADGEGLDGEGLEQPVSQRSSASIRGQAVLSTSAKALTETATEPATATATETVSGGPVAWDHFLGQWVSSGWSELDAILPGGGFRRGSLVEWFAQTERSSAEQVACDRRSEDASSRRLGVWGHGAGLMALRVARELCRSGGTLVVLDPGERFYPPAAAAWGVDLERLIWLRVKEAREAFWALDQALRCPAVRAVWCCLGSWDAHLDGRWFRRFQLAAEASGSVGLLVRSVAYRGRPSWAELQLEVTRLCHSSAYERGMRVKRVRCRGRGAEARRGGQGVGWMSDEPVVTVSLENWQEV